MKKIVQVMIDSSSSNNNLNEIKGIENQIINALKVIF